MKKRCIFIQCASYRDPELKNTIRTALENADKPDKVSFGICIQSKFGEMRRDLYFNGIKQCRTVFIHMDSSKGIGYARKMAQKMLEDEQYTLQIDSHMDFRQSWDTMCIDMLESCRSKKPLLTAYMTDYAIQEEPGCYRLGASEFDAGDGNITVTGQTIIEAKKPQLGILASGHFVFANSDFFNEVPIDPNMQFLYEETLIAPRAWTSGWDIFYPHLCPIQHKWDRSYRRTNWNDRNTSVQEERCRILYQQLVGQIAGFHNFGKYGMGSTRTLQDYEYFSGINFKKMTLTQRAIDGFPTNP